MSDTPTTSTTTTTTADAPPAPPAVVTTTLELPEVRWLWRRLVTVSVLIACLAIVAAIVWRLTDPTALKWIALASQGLAGLALTLYVTGATATDLSKIFAALRGGQLASLNVAPPAGDSAPNP